MKCINTICKKEIPDDSVFCSFCGTEQPKRKECPKCKCVNIPADAFFCPKCGERIEISQTKAEINEMKLAEVSIQLEKYKRKIEKEVGQRKSYEEALINEQERRVSFEKEISSLQYKLSQWEEKKRELDDGLEELYEEKNRLNMESIGLQNERAKLEQERTDFDTERSALQNNLAQEHKQRRRLEIQLEETLNKRVIKRKRNNLFRNIMRGIIAYVIALFLVYEGLLYYTAPGDSFVLEEYFPVFIVTGIVLIILYCIPVLRKFMIWIGGTSFAQYSLSITPGVLIMLFSHNLWDSIEGRYLYLFCIFCTGTFINWLLSLLRKSEYKSVFEDIEDWELISNRDIRCSSK